jgi:TPR repeat protein
MSRAQSAPLVADRWGAARAAEAHYLRMSRLRRMNGADLRRLLSAGPAQIAPWLKSAALYGNVQAQVALGQMLLDGAGVAEDPKAALAWFIRAAQAGCPEGMNMAGRCLENGWGTPVDLTAAAQWYRQAAAKGYDWGEYNYANMLFDGRGSPRNLAGAVEGYRRAAARGHARAMNLLARCLEEGWGVDRDPAAARGWYRRSAEAGYFRARFNYATLLAADGEVETALPFFRAALAEATAESAAAMRALLARQPDPRLAALAADAEEPAR